MAKIIIRNEGISIDVPDGAKLLDYIKENSSMLFGCENGQCGTCMCTIMKGRENLNDPTHGEWAYLKSRNATSGQRLGCQLYVKKGEVEIEY